MIKHLNKKTREGVIYRMYWTQKKNSKLRNHKPPAYTYEEFLIWCFINGYDMIYNKYVKSGYKTSMIPSVDRLDDTKPYTFDNIRLVTFFENQSKNGKNSAKAVSMCDFKGNVIKSFKSGEKATSETGIAKSNIFKACKGQRKTAGGYAWKYATE